MPSPDDLPDSLKPLAFRNAAELRAGRDLSHHLDRLVDGLTLILEARATHAVKHARGSPVSATATSEDLGATGRFVVGVLERLEIGEFEVSKAETEDLIELVILGPAATKLLPMTVRQGTRWSFFANQVADRDDPNHKRVTIEIDQGGRRRSER